MKHRRPTVIYEAPAYLVVAKPPGVLTIPDRYQPELFNLLHYLRKQYGDVRTVHRLDRETSGILVFARSDAAHRHLSRQFEQRQVRKLYWVLVDGRMAEEEGVIDRPIAPHATRSGLMVVSRKGKDSLTRYRVLEHFKHFTLVEADLKTGRTHQIRVHFRALGYPLAVDALYGRREAFYLSELKGKKYNPNREREERPLMARSSLHAYQLEFDDPGAGERMTFQAELPKDFAAVLKQLRKWG